MLARRLPAPLLAALLLAPLLPAAEAAVEPAGPTLPTPRHGASAAWVAGKVYVFGGSDGSDTLDEVLRFDPFSGSLQPTAARLPTSLDLMASAVHEGRVYLLGGKLRVGLYSPAVLRYDPATDTISEMAAKLPTPRQGSAAVAYGGHVYLFGGRSAAALDLDDVVRYDPVADRTTTMSARLPAGGYHLAAAIHGAYVYLFGGSRTGDVSDAIVRYDPATDRMTTLTTRLPAPLAAAAAVSTPEGILLFGGVDRQGRALAQVLRFDPATGAVAAMEEPMPRPLQDVAAAWTGREAYLFGGREGTVESDLVTRYVPPAPPVAAFEARVEDLALTVDAAASHDPDGGGVSCRWDWGDGARDDAGGCHATHAYAEGGERTVTLTVTDDEGVEATARRVVRPTPPDRPPSPGFALLLRDLWVEANATFASDPDGDPLTYLWRWGDGTPDGAGVVATHAYARPGNYTVTLVVTARGLQATSSTTATVTAPPPATPPPPDAAPTPATGPLARFEARAEGLTVRTDASAATGATAYAWEWGDGATSEGGPAATHDYAAPGAYRVRLTVTDAHGLRASAQRTVQVYEPADAPPVEPAPSPTPVPTPAPTPVPRATPTPTREPTRAGDDGGAAQAPATPTPAPTGGTPTPGAGPSPVPAATQPAPGPAVGLVALGLAGAALLARRPRGR